MRSPLPPLRAIQAFEAFGRLGSVAAAARELGVTAGAISQQIKLLEDHLKMELIVKDGRRAALSEDAHDYHKIIGAGFDKLHSAHLLLQQRQAGFDVHLSGLPTLLMKWLNPRLHHFQTELNEAAVRLEAVHAEPDPQLLDRMFRLTYGTAAENFPHRRELFTDVCFPVCSPDFLEHHPDALQPVVLAKLPWIDVDWGPAYSTAPRLGDWFELHGITGPWQKPVSIHSLSSLALEGAASGRGVTLAQSSFASTDLESGRLVKLSEHVIAMPEPYYVCWGNSTMQQKNSRSFLNWLLLEARQQERGLIV